MGWDNVYNKVVDFLNSEFVLTAVGVLGTVAVALITSNSYRMRKSVKRTEMSTAEVADNTKAVGNGFANKVTQDLDSLKKNQVELNNSNKVLVTSMETLLEFVTNNSERLDVIETRLGHLEQGEGC